MKGTRFLLSLAFVLLNLISGNAQEADEKELEKVHAATYRIRDSLSSLYKATFEKIKLAYDPATIKQLQGKVDELDRITEQNNARELALEFEFIRQNLSSPVALQILEYKISRRESANLYGTFNTLFTQLSPKLKHSEKGISLQEKLHHFSTSRIGNVAPKFSVTDLNNKVLTLDSFRNQNYVLLDFWASWCAPCREDFPFLKELYGKYSTKGFEIINISRDENTDSWKKAIEKEAISAWKHFSTIENNSETEKEYFVTAIPVKILIDKDGTIIGRWRGGGEQNKTELRQALEKIFGNAATK